jgi:small subunit ribosomal protein S6
MRHYELMVILDPELEERTVAPSLETYLKIIKESGGRVDKLDVWGKRRMSFEIQKKSEYTQWLICTANRLPSKSWIANLI